MCRMRSIKETAEFFHDLDRDTQLTEKTIRIMVSNGVIPAFKTRKKYLINVDSLLEMFNTPVNGMSKISGAPGGLQAIEKSV